MAIFSWAHPTPMEITRRISADRRIYLLSDLHLGDGTRSDVFLGKDKELIALIQRVRDEDAHLVIVGDAIDFHQAWAMSRVLRAHARLIGELARLAESHGVTYIWGNHDYDISLFKELLRFDVCSSLEIGDAVLVQHGYQFDPFIGPNLDQTHVATRVHHLIERMLDSWIRLPIENFYTLPNRVTFWLAHKLAVAAHAMRAVGKRLGSTRLTDGFDKTLHYWVQSQYGDPGCLFQHVSAWLPDSRYQWLVAGHSHLPGLVPLPCGKTYVNTGSWTFNSAQYALWDGEAFSVHDWVSGRVFGDEPYEAMRNNRHTHKSLIEWWRENYLGLLRFRVGEEGRIAPLPRPALDRDDPAQ